MPQHPQCFESGEQYSKWRAEAVKERDADWEAHCSENQTDPDAICVNARRVFPIAFQIARICDDCTAGYQARMVCAGRCENPYEVFALPTDVSGVTEHGNA